MFLSNIIIGYQQQQYIHIQCFILMSTPHPRTYRLLISIAVYKYVCHMVIFKYNSCWIFYCLFYVFINITEMHIIDFWTFGFTIIIVYLVRIFFLIFLGNVLLSLSGSRLPDLASILDAKIHSVSDPLGFILIVLEFNFC